MNAISSDSTFASNFCLIDRFYPSIGLTCQFIFGILPIQLFPSKYGKDTGNACFAVLMEKSHSIMGRNPARQSADLCVPRGPDRMGLLCSILVHRNHSSLRSRFSSIPYFIFIIPHMLGFVNSYFPHFIINFIQKFLWQQVLDNLPRMH